MPETTDVYLIPTRVLDGDFAGWLRDAMAARGVSLRMLAMRTGLDHTTISRLASGEHQPTLATAVALLRVLVDPYVLRTRVLHSGQRHEAGCSAPSIRRSTVS